MRKSSSSVTALVPAWQSAKFIHKTLESLSAQTHSNLHVIISVDLCKDDTYRICEEYARNDARFRVIRQHNRLGWAGNCNALLNEADTDYAMFALHDDILAPEYTTNLAVALDKSPKAVLSYPDLLLTHANGRKENCSMIELVDADRLKRGEKMLRPIHHWWVPNYGLFRLNKVKKINGLKTHDAGEFSSDWPWLFHMSLLGEFVHVPKTLCYKYYKSNSISQNWESSLRSQYEVRASCMRELWNSELSTEEKMTLAGPLMAQMINIKLKRKAPLWRIRIWLLRLLLNRV